MQISCQLLAPGSARASETLFLRGCSCPAAFSRRVLWAPGEETAGEPQRSTEAGFTAAGGSWAWWHPPVSTVRPLLPIKSRPLPGRLWGCHSVCLLEPGKDTAPAPAPAPRRKGPCRLLASVSDPGAGGWVRPRAPLGCRGSRCLCLHRTCLARLRTEISLHFDKK